jgi:hypothetical protein
LPIVDGGSSLKWALVERGRSPAEADQVVKRAGIAAGLVASTAGVMCATRRRWRPSAGSLAAGLVAIGVALVKLADPKDLVRKADPTISGHHSGAWRDVRPINNPSTAWSINLLQNYLRLWLPGVCDS